MQGKQMRQRAAVFTTATAQAGAVLVPGAPGRTIHLTGTVIAASGSNASTPSVTVSLGSTPVFAHPGVPAGGGLAVSGFDVVGEGGESVVIDCGDPGGTITVMVAYWT